jgi:hypothetical protein
MVREYVNILCPRHSIVIETIQDKCRPRPRRFIFTMFGISGIISIYFASSGHISLAIYTMLGTLFAIELLFRSVILIFLVAMIMANKN